VSVISVFISSMTSRCRSRLRPDSSSAPGLHGQTRSSSRACATRDFTFSLIELLPQLIHLPFGVAARPSSSETRADQVC